MTDYKIEDVTPRPWFYEEPRDQYGGAIRGPDGRAIAFAADHENHDAAYHIVAWVNREETLRGLCEKARNREWSQALKYRDKDDQVGAYVYNLRTEVHDLYIKALSGDLGPLEQLAGTKTNQEDQ